MMASTAKMGKAHTSLLLQTDFSAQKRNGLPPLKAHLVQKAPKARKECRGRMERRWGFLALLEQMVRVPMRSLLLTDSRAVKPSGLLPSKAHKAWLVPMACPVHKAYLETLDPKAHKAILDCKDHQVKTAWMALPVFKVHKAIPALRVSLVRRAIQDQPAPCQAHRATQVLRVHRASLAMTATTDSVLTK